MKKTLFPFIVLLLSQLEFAKAQNSGDFFNEANQLLGKHVMDGEVNYGELKAAPEKLNGLINTIATFDVEPLNKIEQKAFYINAYNLTVIKTIVDAYPVGSPMDISGFFDSKKHLIANKNMTLDELENKLLRPTYKDPRFHFILVCGAIGCPPIINKAYLPGSLDQQMETQAKKAINSNFVTIDDDNKKIIASEICNWYKEDFTQNGQTLIDYLNQYRTTKIPSDYKVTYSNYNWSLNDHKTNASSTNTANRQPQANANQIYNPGTLLKKGKIDLTAFNSIYTQTKSNWLGTDFDGARETFYTTLIQFTYGTSKNARINLGVDVNFRGSARRTDPSFSSIGGAFAFKNNDTNRVGITSIGPRIKISPFKGNNDFSLQSTFLIPTIQHPEGRSSDDGNLYWADWNRLIWWNQFFYTRELGSKFQLFTEADLLFRFATNSDQIPFLDVPLNLFMSYFPTPKITVYAMSQHVPRFTYSTDPNNTTDWVIGSNYTAVGGGLKYQLTQKLQLELLYTNFVNAVNAGLGESFNLGIKFLN